MKIVQVGNHFSPCIGGIERVMEDISTLLSNRGHEVRVVCLDRCANSDEKLPEKEKFGKILVERVPFLDLKYYKIAPGVLGKIRDADVVHVHGVGFFSDFLLLTKPLHGKKVFVSTHGGIFHTKNMGLLKKIYFEVVQRALLSLADKVIAVSKNDFELFGKITKKIVLVENGVDITRFHVAEKKKMTFLFLGRFSRNKRIDLLLEAFSVLDKKNIGFKLIVAGIDWEHMLGELVEKAAELGLKEKVSFVVNPSQEETERLYASSEFFVSASEYEGFGIALVEAMASGCIPLVQKNEGYRQVLGGDSGRKDWEMFIDYADAKSAAKKIIWVAGMKKKEKIGLEEMVLQKARGFSWEGWVKDLEKNYSGVG